MSGIKRARLFRVLVGFVLAYGLIGTCVGLFLPFERLYEWLPLAVAVCAFLPFLSVIVFWLFAHNWRRHEDESTGKLRKTLEAEELQGEAVLDSLDEGILIMNKEGIVKHVNARMLEMMATTESYLLGKHFSKLVSEHVSIVSSSSHTPRLSHNVVKVFETGISVQIEHERVLYHKSNTYLDLAISLLPLKNEQGQISALMIAGRDISDLIRAQEQKDAFLVKASERMASLLQPLQAKVAMLRSEPAGDRDGTIGEMESSLVDLQRLAADIQTYMDSSLGDPTKELKFTDVKTVFDQAASRAAALHADKQVSVVQEIAATSVIADEKRLQLVVDQLVDNAYKFSPDRDKVLLRAVSDGSTTAVIEVADNGVSITPELRETIFEPFAKPYDPSHHGGTGLGMSICKKVVDSWGGEMKISTQETGGTVVSFSIPGAVEAQEDDPYAHTVVATASDGAA